MPNSPRASVVVGPIEPTRHFRRAASAGLLDSLLPRGAREVVDLRRRGEQRDVELPLRQPPRRLPQRLDIFRHRILVDPDRRNFAPRAPAIHRSARDWTSRIPGARSAGSGWPPSAPSSSRHVFGSGATTSGVESQLPQRGHRLRPARCDLTRRSPSPNRSPSTRASCRVPTPGEQDHPVEFPGEQPVEEAKHRLVSAAGASRIDGATKGSPPCFRISSAISTPRRLSSASTRSPSNGINGV